METSVVGKAYGPTEPYLVGREKIREFARAVHAESPLSMDPAAARAAGYADVVAPPTFAVIIAQRAEALFLFDPEAGVDFAHLVHGSERFSATRPILAGDVLTATTHVTRVRSLGRATMLETTTEVVSETDGLVSSVEASFVVEEPRDAH